MKRGILNKSRDIWKRFIVVMLTVTMIISFVPIAIPSVVHAESSDYVVEITEEINEDSGFKHPGVGLTKPILENVREQVQNQVEPWYSYYVAMSNHSFAAKNVTSSNQSSVDPTKPDSVAFNSQGFNSRFIADALKAYTQALMYVITGEEIYRANGMHIIRIWSQMDPDQYTYFNDSHIHTGVPMNRMATAAEILRYTSSANADLAWTEQDTEDFTNNLINPAINTFMSNNNHFMNQHSYSVLGAMAGYLFADDKAGYEKSVEWWSVNETALDQGFNGSVKQLFRLIDTNDLTGEPVDPPVVQHVEMGRDQAHGGGDLTNAAITIRLLHAQDTLLDPVTGTVSTAADAVKPLEFLDHRIIKAADYFWQYMLGYDPPWVPVAYSIAPDGTIKDTYNRISSQYKGRFLTANFWDFYSYYQYEENEDMSDIAPHYAEAFTKKQFLNWQNVDGGEEFWLYLPVEAAADADKFLPAQQPNLAQRNEVEIRYTALDSNTEKQNEGETQFISFHATEEGAGIALLSGGTASKTIGFKIRTNGIAQLDLGTGIKDTLTLPNTDGEWRYVTYTMNEFQFMGDFFDLKVRGGTGVTVDLDHISFEESDLEAPKFKLGNADSEIFSYSGVPINIDFSAVGSTGSVMTYEGSGLPQGTELNTDTGLFSWEEPTVGQYTFVITASDGMRVTAKNVVIHLSADRNSAIAETIADYDEHTNYTEASLSHYEAVYVDTINKSTTQSDEEFIQQLLLLRTAVESLKPVSPRAFDGSLDYTKAVSSTMGTAIARLLDDDSDTFTGFARDPQLLQVLDFGTDFKVSATAFAVQSRMNFTDRGAGIAVFGSNDHVNWTRLTPETTPFNSGLNVLEVDEELQDEKYRFIKYEMVTKHPDIIHNSIQGILELGEFRIYGERHEVGNKLELVTFGAEQGIKGRITQGDSVILKMKAKEEISDVKVNIQGVNATVTTPDQINWTATVLLNNGVASGKVNFTIDYKKQDGSQGDTIFTTTDQSTLFFVDDSDVIENVTDITTLIDSTTNRTAAQTLQQVASLFDNNPATGSDFRNGSGGAGNGSYITFDFKRGNQVSISSVELLARQDQHYTRLGGAVIQGSNDNSTWTSLTDPAASSPDWQILNSKDEETLYRYIRIYNANAWFGNVNEVRFHGKVVSLFADVMNEARAIDRGIYTIESMDVLDTAVSEGEAVLGDDSATQDDLNVAIHNLQAAIQGLTYQPGMPVLELVDQTIVAGNDLTFQVHATNVNTDAEVVYEVEDLPEGAVFDEANGLFEWTPAYGQGGIHELIFKVTANELSSAKVIKIKVIGQPMMGNDGQGELIETVAGAAIIYQVPVSPDPSGEALTFSAEQLPEGATLNPITGIMRWSPTNADYGTHRIMFTVSNGSFEVEVSLQIDVALYVLSANQYTRSSYYVYEQELARIETAMQLPGANVRQLANELRQAEEQLVSFTELPIIKVDIIEAMVAASTAAWGGADNAEKNGWRAFDGSTTTAVDTTANPSWVTVDFGEGRSEHVDIFKFNPRKGYATRVNDASLQASNDGSTWFTLHTISGISSDTLHEVVLAEPNAYRYYRYYAPSGNANIAEIEFYKRTVDRTLLEYLFEQVEQLNESHYTANSWSVLDEAFINAYGVYEAEAEQVQVDTAAHDLLLAIGQLINVAALNDAIAAAELLVDEAEVGAEPGQYPLQAIEALEFSISVAREAVENDDVDQAAVNTAIRDLAEAVRVFQTSVVGGSEPDPDPDPSEEDAEAPTWPEGNALTASNIGTTTVTLSWNGATDNREVTAYKLTTFLGETELNTQNVADGNATSIVIKGLQPNSSYTFKLEAGDAAQNWSDNGPTVTVTTAKFIPPVNTQPEQQQDEPEQSEEAGEPEQPVEPELPQIEFIDVPETHWAANAIKRATALGIVQGYPNNQFKPSEPTTRAQFITMLASAFKWQGEDEQEEQSQLAFTDHNKIGGWAKNAIAQGIERGIITGYTDGSFRPDQGISRVEMIVMLARSLDLSSSAVMQTGFADDAAIPAWGKAAVESLRERGVITGRSNNNFAPNDAATRAEALVMILRVLDNNPK